LKEYVMKDVLVKIMRFLFRPSICFVGWAMAQRREIENRKLLKKLDAAEPSNVHLYGEVRIMHPHRCRLEGTVSIHDAHWNAEGGIKIGKYVHFGPRVTILTVSHNYMGEAIPYDETFILKGVVIEDFVWVGCDVVIAPGTHIEEGCIIAMGATVSGRIPKGSIVGSAKSRVLKTRDMDKYEKLKVEGKFH
jgi:acetyltransferase-like isoleucine patch superfamily enzyme